MGLPGLTSANEDLKASGITVKGKGGALGITCPAWACDTPRRTIDK